MPTYEYRCKYCGHRLEAFQSITAKRRVKCPECGRRGLQRLISAGAGIIFKGSGFYATDYRDASSGRAESKGSEPKSSTSTPAESDKGASPSDSADSSER